MAANVVAHAAALGCRALHGFNQAGLFLVQRTDDAETHW
jgi:hypothetical protein